MKSLLSILAIGVATVPSVMAGPIMWVHDSTGNLGKVDVATGSTTVIGNMGAVMTDIAFSPTGQLFGITFGALYSINRTTGASTLIGAHSIPGGNALVFANDGTLYGAGASSTSLFTINPLSGATANLGNTGVASGGDLAFFGGSLYLASVSSQLIRLNLGSLGTLGASTVIGPFGVANVFGLATGDNNVLYGVAGTQIFAVNIATGAATNPVSYAGQGLGSAFGESFVTEAGAPNDEVPEPATYLAIAAGLAVLLGRKNSRIGA